MWVAGTGFQLWILSPFAFKKGLSCEFASNLLHTVTNGQHFFSLPQVRWRRCREHGMIYHQTELLSPSFTAVAFFCAF